MFLLAVLVRRDIIVKGETLCFYQIRYLEVGKKNIFKGKCPPRKGLKKIPSVLCFLDLVTINSRSGSDSSSSLLIIDLELKF
jgi:hypothetical protein